jgi:hypothetical protein
MADEKPEMTYTPPVQRTRQRKLGQFHSDGAREFTGIKAD